MSVFLVKEPTSYGKESKLSYLGHALVENRNGLIAAAMMTHADG